MIKKAHSFHTQNCSSCVINRSSKKNKIGTGISNLDEFLTGGVYSGNSLVNYIQPGVDGERFGMEILHTTLKNGGFCVFIASNGSPSNIKRNFYESGFNVDSFNERLVFVDDFNSLICASSEEKYVVSNPEKIDELSRTLINLFKELPASTIVFESLSTIMDLCGENETIDAIRIWNKIAKLYSHTIIYNFTAWPYSRKTLDLITNELFNAVISIDGRNEGMIFGNNFKILKLDWEKQMNEYDDLESEVNRFFPEKSVPIPEKIPCLRCEIEEADVRIACEKDTFGCPEFNYPGKL